MPITVLGGTTSAAAAFEVANSCRFNQGDGAYMHKTIGSAGNLDRWTFSCWVKRGNLADTEIIFAVGAGNAGGGSYGVIKFSSSDTIEWENYPSDTASGILRTNRKFRDCSAWYHFVFVWDSGNATAGNRMRMYTNGVEETSFSNDSHPDQNQDNVINNAHKHEIGAMDDNTHFDGYLAEVVFIDGTAYAASDFGEYDEDSPTIWKPKDVSGLTFGTNGFYLDFEASDNLGNDANGGTDLTEDTIAATDQSTDTPTNSFCTMNPLDEPYGTVTMTEGNLKVVQSSDYPYNRATMGVAKGKWYFEGLGVATSGDSLIGIASVAASSSTNALYIPANNYAYYSHASNHGAYSNNALVVSTNYDAYTDDDIISVAFDLDNNKLYFAKNGTWANSGDPTSGSTGTGAVSITAVASTVDGFYFPAAADYGGSPRTTWSMNFGSPAHTVSSGNADANGYGNFEYAVPSGYYALCTKNLAEFG
mgnify:CR=1 FL=1